MFACLCRRKTNRGVNGEYCTNTVGPGHPKKLDSGVHFLHIQRQHFQEKWQRTPIQRNKLPSIAALSIIPPSPPAPTVERLHTPAKTRESPLANLRTYSRAYSAIPRASSLFPGRKANSLRYNSHSASACPPSARSRGRTNVRSAALIAAWSTLPVGGPLAPRVTPCLDRITWFWLGFVLGKHSYYIHYILPSRGTLSRRQLRRKTRRNTG